MLRQVNVKLAIFLGLGFLGFNVAANNDDHHERNNQILKCRAKRDAHIEFRDSNTNLVQNVDEGKVLNSPSAEEFVATPVSNVSVMTEVENTKQVINPTLAQRKTLLQSSIPTSATKTLELGKANISNTTIADEQSLGSHHNIGYEFTLIDGLLRPQLEQLVTLLFPDFSANWSQYQMPFKWQGKYTLSGPDRWALLDSVLSSYGIRLTVNRNHVMTFIAKESE